MEEVIREGTWRCPNCRAGNRGRDVKCPGCGQARENVPFEYDENAAAVTDAGELAVARAGGDGCADSVARPTAPRCRQCSADRGEGKQRPETDVPALASPASAPDLELPAPSTFAPSARYLFAGIVAVLVGLGILASWTSESRLSLSKAHWERGIGIEKLGPETREDWQGSVPAGACTRPVHVPGGPPPPLYRSTGGRDLLRAHALAGMVT